MAKRLFIPRNAGEAERFMWHAIDHLRDSENRKGTPHQDVAANILICQVIEAIRDDVPVQNTPSR